MSEFTARNFNQDQYNQYDEYGKQLMVNFLTKKRHEILNSTEDYNHDLITKMNNHVYYFEIEIKVGYPFTSQSDYKFQTVSFLGRKKRLHDIHPFYYVIISKETECFLCCNSNDIFKNEYLEQIKIDSNQRYGNDQLYRVPKSKCNFFNLNINMENQDNSGALFRNDKKVQGSNQPDYTGNITINGERKRLAAWIKESKAGNKFMSIQLSEFNNEQGNQAAPKQAQEDDDLPF